MNIRFLLAILLMRSAMVQAADDLVVADFEGTDYAGWVATGDAFGSGPAKGGFSNQQKVDGYQGTGLVNSFLGGDRSQGTLTSPSFRIDRDCISFLVGGGSHAGKTCVNLLIDRKVVMTATGQDDEHLDWYTWDVKSLRGKDAVIEIVDKDSGSWGHINVDQIIQTDHPPVPPENDVTLYQESHRPQFHFTSATGWLNDPNGLVFDAGEYHLFFQHNPKSTQWGNMTWGHAVSRDLVRWTQLPDAIKPDELGTIFSGSAVVDWNNTSKFATGSEKSLVAMYTAAGGTSPESKGKLFSQCIAFSNDHGRTWTKYANNPVIPHIAGENRDPKVVWYEPGHKWVVALYKEGDTYALFSSPDLKQWTMLQEIKIAGCSECPDFFQMPVDGDPQETKWVFTVAGGQYVVGGFDGAKFTPEQPPMRVDFGRNYYAVQSYSGIPASDGRRIQIAWMRDGKYPRMPFNQQMSFPAEMTLKKTPDGFRIFRMPVREIESLHEHETKLVNLPVRPGDHPLAEIKGDLFHIQADIEAGDAAEFGLVIRGEAITYTVANHTLNALGAAPVELENRRLRLEILVDRTSIETFVSGGRVSFTSCFLPKPSESQLELFARGGSARIVTMSVFFAEVGVADGEVIVTLFAQAETAGRGLPRLFC